MPPRLYLDAPWTEGDELDLPAEQARHVQVLRLQPGAAVTLFNGQGGEWAATVVRMGTKLQVAVRIGKHTQAARELPAEVVLAVGMPANERMDTLVEKATELGVSTIQPLQCARSVLRLSGERADKRQAHWQAVAVAAAEQSGRTQVPRIAPVHTPAEWLAGLPAGDAQRHLLCFAPDARLARALVTGRPAWVMSGPEGGLTPEEEALARQHGFAPLSLGPRVLRADTAPLAALVLLAAGQ